MMLWYQQTLVGDAYPATVRPLCLVGLLGRVPHRPLWRSVGIWTWRIWQVRLFTCLRLPRSYPFPTRLRWPSLRYWTTASTVFCVDYGLQCGCCHGRLLDFSSHLALIWLCSIFFVFALFLVSSHL